MLTLASQNQMADMFFFIFFGFIILSALSAIFGAFNATSRTMSLTGLWTAVVSVILAVASLLVAINLVENLEDLSLEAQAEKIQELFPGAPENIKEIKNLVDQWVVDKEGVPGKILSVQRKTVVVQSVRIDHRTGIADMGRYHWSHGDVREFVPEEEAKKKLENILWPVFGFEVDDNNK